MYKVGLVIPVLSKSLCGVKQIMYIKATAEETSVNSFLLPRTHVSDSGEGPIPHQAYLMKSILSVYLLKQSGVQQNPCWCHVLSAVRE